MATAERIASDKWEIHLSSRSKSQVFVTVGMSQETAQKIIDRAPKKDTQGTKDHIAGALVNVLLTPSAQGASSSYTS